MAIRRMPFECWMLRLQTHTQIKKKNTYCFSTAKMITAMRLNVTYIRTMPVLSCLVLFIL